MRSMTFSWGACVALFVVACGSPGPGIEPPAPTQSTLRLVDFKATELLTEALQTSATLPSSAAEVWAVLPGAYDQLGIPVRESYPDQMALGIQGFKVRNLDGKRMSFYLDCGSSNSGVRANVYDVTLTISTRVVDAPESGAVMATTVDAWAKPRMTNGSPVHCLSKTTLEKRLVEVVSERLGHLAHR